MKITDARSQMPRNGTWNRRTLDSIEYCTIHHDAVVRPAKYNSIKRYQTEAWDHINREHWPSIGYHYKVDNVGEVFLLNELEDVTYHDKNNYDSLGVCLDGYFHTPHNQQLTVKQEEGLVKLLNYLRATFPKIKLRGHREAPGNRPGEEYTACPGDILMRWLSNFRVDVGEPMTEQERKEFDELKVRVQTNDQNIENTGKYISNELKAALGTISKDIGNLRGATERNNKEFNEGLHELGSEFNSKHLKTMKMVSDNETIAKAARTQSQTAEAKLLLLEKEVKKIRETQPSRVSPVKPFLDIHPRRFLAWLKRFVTFRDSG